MFGLRYLKAPATTFVLHYKNGKILAGSAPLGQVIDRLWVAAQASVDLEA